MIPALANLLLAAALLTGATRDTASLLARGEEALHGGRYEEARSAYAAALGEGPSYEALIGLGVALGRLGRLEEATIPLTQALPLDNRRADAWVERGGLRFLQGRYAEAISDLEAALERSDDAYTRDLLATALHLTGRSDEALRQWNRLGQPQLRLLEVQGLEYTRASLVRETIDFEEGGLLDVRRVRRARLLLSELGVFDRVTVRPVPLSGGEADLDVALLDRRGLARSKAELISVTAVNLVSHHVQLRYVNLLGRGLAIGGRWRWERNRPDLSLAFEWPRPFGWTGKLLLRSSRGSQGFALTPTFGTPPEKSLDRRLRSLDLTYRQVLGDGTAVEYGPRVDWRSYAAYTGQRPVYPTAGLRASVEASGLGGPAAAAGSSLGWETAIEQRVLETYRSQVAGRVSLLSVPAGSAESFAKGLLAVTYRGLLGPNGEEGLERSVLAIRLGLGAASRRAPIDEWFAPGASSDMDLPLRGHRQTRDGLLGVAPLTRRAAIANLEWRQRVLKGLFGELTLVAFCDAAWLWRPVVADPEIAHPTQQDVGLGLRLGRSGSATIRVDFGYGLRDRHGAVTLGLGQAF